MEVHQFSGGYSNLTYNVVIGDHDLILRRPPFGANVKSGHDMEREYKVQNLLKPHFSAVAPVYHLCTDHDVMGCDFYDRLRLIYFYHMLLSRVTTIDRQTYTTYESRLLRCQI